MKKPYICTIIGASGRDCALVILFQIYGSKTSVFDGNLFWVGQYDPPNLHIEKKTNPMLI